jgi:hypothetical protein
MAKQQKDRSKRQESKQAILPQLSLSDATDLAPLEIIRRESVFENLPFHNLIKGGEINIQITHKNENGKVDLYWEVVPGGFGRPGQLAYNAETLWINRKIDELGRPVPRIIKLGSLNQICEYLGSNKTELKRALRQNASTTISAKLNYKGNDGRERILESTFTRYSVHFTGETLPSGQKADEVCIVLNEPYLEVLNSAPIRPLNYGYLRELSPTSRRFYEIVSYKIYAAIKYNHPAARLLYSEYCTYSAQRRHLDFERARVQMYRVHKPHLESSYIAKVEFEECTDEEGKPDWVMYYTPGKKAMVEFQTFNRKQDPGQTDIDSDIKTLDVEPASAEKTDASALVAYFHRTFFGVSKAMKPRP